MPEHRRRGHLRQGRPVRPAIVNTRETDQGSKVPDNGAHAEAARNAANDPPQDDVFLPDEFPEVPTAHRGFASDRKAFLGSANKVADVTGLSPEQVIHDYWLVRSLHALSKRMPRDGVLLRDVGRWGFGGGTSLTTAWRFVRRYSEDIDGMLFVGDASKRSSGLQRRACFDVADWATDDRDITVPAVEGNRVLTSFFKAGDVPRYIKFETTIIEAPADDLVAPREIASLMHLHGDPAWAEQYPELGGFVLPCISPTWIAVNKFDALHRRAINNDHRGLRERGRDLYDLWSLASQQTVASDIRRRTPELWEPAAAGIGRSPAPRPDGGYADSPAFIAGTGAYEALRDGYMEAVGSTVWGNTPKFETAIKTVRALDTGSD